MDLDLLRSFLAIYRQGSITKAAKVLDLSQPAVSAQLRTLERHLGRKLFERTARGVVANAAGEDLARAAAPHVDALEGVVASAGARSGELAGPLFLGGPAELVAAKVLPSLAAPAAANRVEIRITLGTAEELVDELAEGNLDLAIATKRISRRGVTYDPLYEERFALVAGPEWARLRVRVADEGAGALRYVPLLSYAEDLPILRRYWRVVFGERLAAKPALVIADLRALRAAAEAGLGITVLPRYLCDEALTEGRLVTLHTPGAEPTNTIHLAATTRTESVRPSFIRDTLRRAAAAW